MDEVWLKVSFNYAYSIHPIFFIIIIFEIPTCGEHVIFVTEFVILGQTLQFYEVKFIFYYEKATKFCEIFPLLLTTVHTVKSKGKISQNFVVFSEYMNFEKSQRTGPTFDKFCFPFTKYMPYKYC